MYSKEQRLHADMLSRHRAHKAKEQYLKDVELRKTLPKKTVKLSSEHDNAKCKNKDCDNLRRDGSAWCGLCNRKEVK